MKPMFLPAVEAHAEPSPYVHAIQMMQQATKEYPQIWHLFAFKPPRRIIWHASRRRLCARKRRFRPACAS